MKIADSVIAERFGKHSQTQVRPINTGNVVIYTRVSTKEQADNNMSLETQRKTIEEYAQKRGLKIISVFGGTYESAKTDGRKEFQRMLKFIKGCKGQVSQILVYALDRFSRTGGSAIKLVSDLREKQGVEVFAITQPTDTANASGRLHQSIQFLFSEFDNQQRRQRVIIGMTEKFKQGYWVVRPPQGYDIIKVNGQKSIVVNAEGKKIRKAFEWKAAGLKNEDIIERLQDMGVNMYKQQLHKILVNPFYCGLIAHGMLNGEVVEGKHEAMISKTVFLTVNNIITGSTRYGVPHERENDNLPLKVFLKCSECDEPMTGYYMKNKNIYYYKCRTKGCHFHKNATVLNEEFATFIEKYTLQKRMMKVFMFQLEHGMHDSSKENVETEKTLKVKLGEVDKKIFNIGEQYYALREMSKESFEKYQPKYEEERKEILDKLLNISNPISDYAEAIRKISEVTLKTFDIWTKGGAKAKEAVQRLIFPQGITYNREKGEFLTKEINSFFELIPQLQKVVGSNKKGTPPFLKMKSPSAEREGFEPPVPLRVQQFSRLPHSTALPSLRKVAQRYNTLLIVYILLYCNKIIAWYFSNTSLYIYRTCQALNTICPHILCYTLHYYSIPNRVCPGHS
jgi:site-specific DNA recombinase